MKTENRGGSRINTSRPKVVNPKRVNKKVTKDKLPLVNAIIRMVNTFEKQGKEFKPKLSDKDKELINQFVFSRLNESTIVRTIIHDDYKQVCKDVSDSYNNKTITQGQKVLEKEIILLKTDLSDVEWNEKHPEAFEKRSQELKELESDLLKLKVY